MKLISILFLSFQFFMKSCLPPYIYRALDIQTPVEKQKRFNFLNRANTCNQVVMLQDTFRCVDTCHSLFSVDFI